MVKKSTNITNLGKFLTTALSEEALDLGLALEEFLDLLVENYPCEKALIISKSQDKIYSSANLDVHNFDYTSPKTLKFTIEDWGYLYVIHSQDLGAQKFYEDLVISLSLFIRSAEIKIRSKLVADLTSDIRRTLKPDIALEKIFNSLKNYAEIKDFYFFKRIIDTEEEEIIKKYNLFFHGTVSNLCVMNTFQIITEEEIKNFKYIDPELEVEVFLSKVRGHEWGLLVISREEKFNSEEREIFKLFAEQMGTVFNQHELHSESLTMAQREFLLNQITTRIRESLVVDSIVKTAVEEAGQVMGVESCGLILLNRKIKGALSYEAWSIDKEYSPKMIDAMYSTLKTELEPNWLEASKHGSMKEIPAYLCCGLFKDNSKELIGILAVSFFSQRRVFTLDEKLLLEGIAKQLEIALIQASIYQEAQQTRREMALLHRLSTDIRDSLDISVVLGQIAKGLGEVLGLNRCFVRRVSDDHRIIKTEREYVSHGFTPTADMIFGFEREWIQSLSEKDTSLKSLETLNIPSTYDRFSKTNPELYKIMEAIGLRTYLSIPLVAQGKILGTINVHQCDRERVFLPEEIEFIFRVGSEAAIAIEHASLFETINRFNKTDPDTGLYNKKYFREIAEKEILKAKENGKNISFMLVDVDHLKDINDDSEHGGHTAGDEAIQILATVLANTVRQTPVSDLKTRISDVVGRFGGDEFMVLLPNTHIEDAIRAAERVAFNLSKAGHSTWPKALTCSIGVAGTPKDIYDYEGLKTIADKALYLSKHKGRNCISSSLEL